MVLTPQALLQGLLIVHKMSVIFGLGFTGGGLINACMSFSVLSSLFAKPSSYGHVIAMGP